MVVVYSYDMNVLRAYPKKGKAMCLPFTIGGRKLKTSELRRVAQRAWGKMDEFHYLKEGQG